MSWINPFESVVLPDPVAPEIRIFSRALTARSKNSTWRPARSNASNSSSCGLTFFSAIRVSLNKPAASKSASVIVTLDGFRTVIDTVSSGTTGGTTICTRSPVGKMVETMGFSRVTSWLVNAAAAVASAIRFLKSSDGSFSQVQQPCRSMPTSCGKLMTSSVTLASSRYLRKGAVTLSRTAVFFPGAAIISAQVRKRSKSRSPAPP